ncbi:MAG: Cof-type HAD-IIB family hydrolase [Oscillospiraceae bacterium]|nr:Cof-type HAD-IIB family hydrolase [Oscillospiraceae bacterium]
MKYKLLAADMDGTLLNGDYAMTRRTREALRAAMDAGVLFVPSTGRPMLGMEWLNALFPEDLPYIVFNGALVLTGKSRGVLYSRPLDAAYAHEIFEMGLRLDIPMIIWEGDRLFTNRDCEATREYRTITGAQLHVIGALDHSVTKMLWLLTPEEALRYQEEMRARYRERLNWHTSRPYMLEVVAAEASKGRALAEIGAAYGIEAGEMIAVGDGHNDISMLEYAGLGVAMGNAPEAVKRVCQHTTLSNDEDGVAAVIEKYFL